MNPSKPTKKPATKSSAGKKPAAKKPASVVMEARSPQALTIEQTTRARILTPQERAAGLAVLDGLAAKIGKGARPPELERLRDVLDSTQSINGTSGDVVAWVERGFTDPLPNVVDVDPGVVHRFKASLNNEAAIVFATMKPFVSTDDDSPARRRYAVLDKTPSEPIDRRSQEAVEIHPPYRGGATREFRPMWGEMTNYFMRRTPDRTRVLSWLQVYGSAALLGAMEAALTDSRLSQPLETRKDDEVLEEEIPIPAGAAKGTPIAERNLLAVVGDLMSREVRALVLRKHLRELDWNLSRCASALGLSNATGVMRAIRECGLEYELEVARLAGKALQGRKRGKTA